MAVNAQTVELLITIARQAASVTALGVQAFARWRANAAEISAMAAEGRNPTPAEHAQLSRRSAALDDNLREALARAKATQAAEEHGERLAFEAEVDAVSVVEPTGEE